MTSSILAEVRRLRRWPALWVLCGTWLILNMSFGYLFPYLTYRNSTSGQVLLAQILPAAAPIALVQGMPMFGGALLMILGALAIGSGYGWGTWKTVFTTGPGRTSALAGTFITVGFVVAALVTVTLGLDL